MALSGRSPAEAGPLAGRDLCERRLRAAGVEVSYLEVVDVDPLLEDAIEKEEPPPYGAVLWASGVALAERLSGRELRGITVIDIGAGCGVFSLVAAAKGARIIALDSDPLARALLEAAAGLRALPVEVRPFDLFGEEALPPGDLYVLADLLYERPLAEAAARRVLEALALGAEVWVADPGRAGREAFQLFLCDADIDAVFDDVAVQVPGEARPQRVGVFTRARRAR